MIVILACAKRQRPRENNHYTLSMPHFASHAQTWMSKLAELSLQETAQLLKVSPKLAENNLENYQNAPHAHKTCALSTFDGDVYQAMNRESWDAKNWQSANEHLRIISGLYGILKPSDAIVPHRLEMSTRVPWLQGSLSQYWQRPNYDYLRNDPQADCIINLASQNYASALKPSDYKKFINIHFWNKNKDGKLGVIGIHAKRARGRMIEAVCKHGWSESEMLKQFNNGYQYEPQYSDDNNWIFIQSD